MFEVRFLNEGASVLVEAGSTLTSAARAADVKIETPCGGAGVCGKCRVSIRRAGHTEDTTACTYKVTADIEVVTRHTDEEMSINDGAGIKTRQISGSSFELRDLPPLEIDKSPPDAAVPYAQKFLGDVPLSALQELSRIESHGTSRTVRGIYESGKFVGICGEGARVLGLAVDIGTTGVSMTIEDLITAETAGRASFLNPQYQYGGDVLSRSAFCAEDMANTEVLQGVLIRKINEQIDQILGEGGGRDIRRAAVAGNTIMQHIFLGVDPGSITSYPYRPTFLRAVRSRMPSLHIAPDADVWTLPCISGYIGGDITAGLVSTGLIDEDRSVLFIDIGTNGEIVLKLGGRLYGTSTAAGPALEGMNISCGCRAVKGAIESVSFEDGKFVCRTIGGADPTGVCGSGLVDLTAAMLDAGVIKKSGMIAGAKSFDPVPGITITQNDIRQIQLAKGAISSGIKMLLTEAGAEYCSIDAIYIAGSFGYHLSPSSIKRIGMIDPNFDGEISFVGNSSLEGARAALKDSSVTDLMQQTADAVTSVELSNRNDFQDIFVKELPF